jgi:hypothetical protein
MGEIGVSLKLPTRRLPPNGLRLTRLLEFDKSVSLSARNTVTSILLNRLNNIHIEPFGPVVYFNQGTAFFAGSIHRIDSRWLKGGSRGIGCCRTVFDN